MVWIASDFLLLVNVAEKTVTTDMASFEGKVKLWDRERERDCVVSCVCESDCEVLLSVRSEKTTKERCGWDWIKTDKIDWAKQKEGRGAPLVRQASEFWITIITIAILNSVPYCWMHTFKPPPPLSSFSLSPSYQ